MSLLDRMAQPDKGQPGHQDRGSSISAIEGQIHRQVVTRLTEEGVPFNPMNAGTESEQLRRMVIHLTADIISSEQPHLSPEERDRISLAVCDDILAYGPITPMLNDPEVTEIMMNGPREVYVERRGVIGKASVSFRDGRHLMALVEKILAPLGRRVDESSPMVDARLPDGSRLNAVIPPISLNGPVVTIRKFQDSFLSLQSLVAGGTLSPEMARFLECSIQSKRNIIVSGGTGSGKTTVLNALSNFIPQDQRIITIEDAAELRLRQGHVISLEARPSNAEGRGQVTIRDLLRNALRMRPDRIVIGEVRGGEALDLLQAMNTGHDGCLSTLHANKPRDALARLETMAMMSNLDLPVRVLREQIASAVDLIVHQERYEDGSRRVSQITEVQGIEGDIITLQDVFLFERQGVMQTGKVLGAFRQSPVRPASLDLFRRFGLPADCWVPAPEGGGKR